MACLVRINLESVLMGGRFNDWYESLDLEDEYVITLNINGFYKRFPIASEYEHIMFPQEKTFNENVYTQVLDSEMVKIKIAVRVLEEDPAFDDDAKNILEFEIPSRNYFSTLLTMDVRSKDNVEAILKFRMILSQVSV
ncbi:hypothetical protein QNH20_09985 [Neobacillus sp. WH10]|uniref:hypothetical protein n=1 Tax=Neobacillus sp. WH10 TaxID=3047873 RepID=UPI0024C1786A|nr:hypothetical protein [Neobacillus sp. WH10]WHY79438.1 hypothetical protein QNH20_09985 [Neobacillus sp. WH10]